MPLIENETCLSQLPPAAREEVQNFIEFYLRFMSSPNFIKRVEKTGLPLIAVIGTIDAGLREQLMRSLQTLTEQPFLES